ncbi:5'-nucleotidase [Thermodesulfovibrio sp. N1]|uniref:bifunctional metallophosphatase/5'-nucleotidase n=1 Tax=unclassified Thermodesulfovibrio TaxID=2645936 RepID=UPI00083AB350|nr:MULTISPECIES: 5'-nucleotidase C-terminal domain-containing protein [unclassified Thermodesulfovibrio]MDI1472046.1 5'-nucleotidase C-terminal domain-containing protein [Thermodesulfovibrio sp. 1176]ODA45196.1 5'-nucleotidase [Thermodesulfovibrio sp. N1]
MEFFKKFILFLIFLLIFVSNLTAETIELRILYINDFHGFANPYKPLGSEKLLGGVSHLAEMVKKLRNEKPSIFLAAGDMIQGDNWANLFEGKSVIELMNAMEFDVMVVGNHEFDFGLEVLKQRILEARFPILGANVEGLELLKPYIIKEISDIKIAIVGIVTEDTPVSTHPKNVKGLTFLSPEKTVEKYIKELKSQVNIIIVLSHIGHYADRKLAEKIKGINIIVGGHSHTKIEKPILINETIVVQAWEHGKALGVLDLTLMDGKITKFEGYLKEISPEKIDAKISVKAIVDKYNEMVDAVLSEKIGVAQTDFDGENVRKKETNLGNFIADIIKKTAKADIAIINGGGIRASIKKGDITVKDIYSVLPFNNYIVAIKLTGKQIKEALEHGVSAIEKGEGRFPQVSGIKFSYNRDNKPGFRIQEVFIGEKPLELDKEYSVATNDFLAAGGDGYKVFGEAIKASKDFVIIGGVMKGEKVIYSDSSRYLRDVVVEYIKNEKIINYTTEGRITEIKD